MSERKGSKGAVASAGQAHLPAPPTSAQDESARIDKLVSLTYDSNSEVRRQAAQALAKIDDPRAVFALLELGADKDPAVQDLARSSLDHFKGEEKETLVSLEKIFEARQEGKPPPQDIAEARQKLMPSLERLFSKNKAARDRLMPSIEKLFSWMPNPSAGGHPAGPASSAPASNAPAAYATTRSLQPPASTHASSPTSRASFEQVATAHLTEEEKEKASAERAEASASMRAPAPSAYSGSSDAGGDGDEDDDASDALPASVPISQHSDPLASVQSIRPSAKSALEQAEADVGVPAHLRSSDDLRRMRGGAGYSSQARAFESDAPLSGPRPGAGLSGGAFASGQRSHPSSSSSSMQARMEEATNFPVPEYLQPKAPSPTSAIPAMMEEAAPEPMLEEEGVKMPRHALYYYKLAYAISMTPGIKASEVKKERERLIKEAKADIELAFELALKRTQAEGIESLSGLKPGMKKLSTLPLEVLDNVVVSVPHGKKLLAYNRLLLSDSKHQMPLYVPPPRADGIRCGDLLSLRDAYVDYWVKSNPAPGGSPGELVLMLGKNGQLIVTK